MIQKINKTKSWFLEEFNKILDETLINLTKENKERRFKLLKFGMKEKILLPILQK